jgi:hypothetical protein
MNDSWICPACGKNSLPDVRDIEVGEIRFNDENYSVEVDLGMAFHCSMCGIKLADVADTSSVVFTELKDYCARHGAVDLYTIKAEKPLVIPGVKRMPNNEMRYGVRWKMQVRAGENMFNAVGDLYMREEQILGDEEEEK